MMKDKQIISSYEYSICKEIEKCASEEMEKIFKIVPFTREFHEGKLIDKEYYKRHIIESVIRIGLNNEVDAYCLYKIGYQDKLLAKKLVNYLAEEYGHDIFLIGDLKEFNVLEKEVLEIQPFFSTQLLIGYLYYSIKKDGAMPTLVWNWLVEWYSNKYNTKITMKAEKEFGIEKVKGVIAHLEVDNKESHIEDTISALKLVIKGEEDKEKVKQYITNFMKLIGMYFQELYDVTIAGKLQK